MVKVQGALSKLPEDPKWSKNDKRLHSNFKGWMNHTIHNSIAKINTSLATFEETNLKLVDAPPRQKRQIIIGLGSLIVGGIIGVAYNYLHEEQVVDVLQKKKSFVPLVNVTSHHVCNATLCKDGADSHSLKAFCVSFGVRFHK